MLKEKINALKIWCVYKTISFLSLIGFKALSFLGLFGLEDSPYIRLAKFSSLLKSMDKPIPAAFNYLEYPYAIEKNSWPKNAAIEKYSWPEYVNALEEWSPDHNFHFSTDHNPSQILTYYVDHLKSLNWTLEGSIVQYNYGWNENNYKATFNKNKTQEKIIIIVAASPTVEDEDPEIRQFVSFPPNTYSIHIMYWSSYPTFG